MAARRSFKRQVDGKSYRKLFIIAVEGTKTEYQYFSFFNGAGSVIGIECLRPNHSSPSHVLRCMKDRLKREGLRTSDEAWLVVDKDAWNEEELSDLYQWSRQQNNYGFALSNPNFEYWLLLHFENGDHIGSPNQCKERLKRHINGYDKGIHPRMMTRERIEQAIRRARNRDCPPCIEWPRISGTTVYRLVEKLIR